jgi:hypothetical protein
VTAPRAQPAAERFDVRLRDAVDDELLDVVDDLLASVSEPAVPVGDGARTRDGAVEAAFLDDVVQRLVEERRADRPNGAGSCWHISSMSCSISGFAIPKQERKHKRWNEEQGHTSVNQEQPQPA